MLPLDLQSHEQASMGYKRDFKMQTLINNGGIGHLGSVDEMEFQIEKQVMEVNFWAAVALTKAVLPHMLSRNTGQIGLFQD